MKKYTRSMMLGALVALHGFVQAVVSPTNDETATVVGCTIACDEAKNDVQASKNMQKVCALPESSQVFLKELEVLSLAQRAERLQQIFATRADYFSKLAKAATREAKKALRAELAAQLAALDELALLDVYLAAQATEEQNNE